MAMIGVFCCTCGAPASVSLTESLILSALQLTCRFCHGTRFSRVHPLDRMPVALGEVPWERPVTVLDRSFLRSLRIAWEASEQKGAAA